jgi:hypothetical protein
MLTTSTCIIVDVLSILLLDGRIWACGERALRARRRWVSLGSSKVLRGGWDSQGRMWIYLGSKRLMTDWVMDSRHAWQRMRKKTLDEESWLAGSVAVDST